MRWRSMTLIVFASVHSDEPMQYRNQMDYESTGASRKSAGFAEFPEISRAREQQHLLSRSVFFMDFRAWHQLPLGPHLR